MGTHPITAHYIGDTNFSASTSDVLDQVVGQLAQSITFAPLVDKTYGDAPFTVSATGGGSGNPVTFTASGNCTSTGTYGTTITITGAGSCTVTAHQAGNGTYAPAPDVPRSFNIATKALTVTASNQSKTYGTVATLGTSAFTTSGLVGSDTVTSVTLNSTGAPASATVAGSPYPIVPSAAIGTGLSNYAISYANGSLTVIKATLTVTANNKSRAYGTANPTLDATITGFVNGETIAVVSGSPLCSTTATTTSPVGTYPITCVANTLSAANYGFSFVAGTLTVTSAGRPTTTTLTSNHNPSSYNQSVTFVVIVARTSGTGIPTGTVTFRDGSTVLATRTLILGVTTYTTSSLGLGSHTITATYNPTGTWATSSRTLVQTVNARSTTTSLTSSRNPSNHGQSVTFTATVTSSFGTPTGTVTFREGSTVLATVTLNRSGRAAFSKSNLSRGNHTISATYNPSVSTFLTSSRSLVQHVN